ncbi:LamG-like jellyroll fold domain-containing protein [Lacrimispora sp. 38-1]|uniref:LamG-like jellyroll fold domain-containing protein n=1 Tax=Lacrimispora sp. 38-1 TaxID=3125778 RepID=UPI003CF067FF
MSKRALLRVATCICFMFCVSFLGQITAFAEEVKPIHEYNFDSDDGSSVFDAIRENAVDGIAYGENNTTFVTGYNGIGKARKFGGRNDYITMSEGVFEKAKPRSIRFKVKKDQKPTTRTETIMSTQSTDGGGTFIGILDTGILAIYTGHPGYSVKTPKSICDGQWHDILFTCDYTGLREVKLYVDDMVNPVAKGVSQGYFSDEYILSIGRADTILDDGKFKGYLDDIKFYNKIVIPGSTIPDTSNLKATAGNSKVDLSWNSVTDATSYIVKRSTTAGGPYTTIATGITGTTYTDTGVTNGTTYYYVVTAIINGSEGWNSNEASATPQASTDQPTGNKALLVISMVTGERKEYEMTADKINNFVTWYNSKAASSPTYVIEKEYNKASFTARKDYIAYEQISNFEVNEYNN